jgi:PAS domain S-box-containing protein
MPLPKILIVEDEGIEALDLQQRLTNMGYTVDVAVCGEEAIEKTGKMIPDLVLMDIMLPGKIDGVTASGEIRTRFDIPVVFLTAYADEDTVQRAKITEPFGYIVKPFKEREVQITIEMALYKCKMEKKLRESEKWFSTTLRSIGDAVIATDNNGLITFMNPVAESLLDWRTADVLNKKLTDVFTIINKYTRKPVDNPVSKVLKEGITAGLANHTILISRNGQEIPIDDSAAPIKDDKGKILGVILVFRDITERERAEEELRKSEEQLKKAQEIAHLGSWQLDLVSNSLTWSDEVYRIFGLQPQEFGATYEAFLDAVHPDDRAAVDAAYSGSLREGKDTYEIEHRVVRKSSGEIRVVDEKCEHIRDASGRIILSIGMVHDITERKRAEEELRRNAEQLAAINKELESFSYSISHDLRAPLRTIKSFSGILLEEYSSKLDAEGEGFLKRIMGGTDKMSELIDDMLSLSKISRQEMNPHEIDLSAIVGAIINELRQSEPGRKVEVAIAEELKAYGDSRLMNIALSNLIGNAWKYSSKAANARIDFGTIEKNGEMLYYVRDNGAGFDMKHAEKLFAPFQRLHSDSEFSGTGIGLAIVDRVIKRHDGKIWAEAKEGQGATFFFTVGNC